MVFLGVTDTHYSAVRASADAFSLNPAVRRFPPRIRGNAVTGGTERALPPVVLHHAPPFHEPPRLTKAPLTTVYLNHKVGAM